MHPNMTPDSPSTGPVAQEKKSNSFHEKLVQFNLRLKNAFKRMFTKPEKKDTKKIKLNDKETLRNKKQMKNAPSQNADGL